MRQLRPGAAKYINILENIEAEGSHTDREKAM